MISPLSLSPGGGREEEEEGEEEKVRSGEKTFDLHPCICTYRQEEERALNRDDIDANRNIDRKGIIVGGLHRCGASIYHL
jgi:hypothetical protein